jgi:3'-phosphoadenosine 5'-phosphosulfate sulfotransferase (PAPS reductase)/FAD synthetase
MIPDLALYDRVVVAFSGGKDSLACVLRLLDLGVPRDRMELWHHDVDGGPDAPRFMDWPCTADYCRKVATALGITLLFNWRDGGFLGEMLRDNAPTGAVVVNHPDGSQERVGGRGPRNTRLRFPQVAADLSVRWCSAYLKIDVAASVMCNSERFNEGRFLFVTGERREESAARSRYREQEPGRASNKRRHVDHWRAVIDMTEGEVWELIGRWKINPHPAYRLGFGRVSCMACIFGSDGQWTAIGELAPDTLEAVALYEDQFGRTIDRKGVNVRTRAARGRSIIDGTAAELRAISQLETWDEPVFVEDWHVPAGAYKACGGPT